MKINVSLLCSRTPMKMKEDKNGRVRKIPKTKEEIKKKELRHNDAI